MGIDVFISYHTSSSSHITKAICNSLEAAGIRCWYAPRDTIGAYANSITSAISACKIFVIVLNREASFSEDVLNEMELAFERVRNKEKVAILPFHISSEEISGDAKYYLRRMHWIDAINQPLEESINNLKKAIIAWLGEVSENTVGEESAIKILPEPSVDKSIVKKLSGIPLLEGWQGYMLLDDTRFSALMSVEDSFIIKGRGTVICGDVLRGQISIGDDLEIVGLSHSVQLVTVAGITKKRKLLDCAEEGDNDVGILVKRKDSQRKGLFDREHKIDVERGQVIAKAHTIKPYCVVECQIKCDFLYTRLKASCGVQFDFGSVDITAKIRDILNENEDIITVVAELIVPLALEEGFGFRVLNAEREAIGVGIVTRLIR